MNPDRDRPAQFCPGTKAGAMAESSSVSVGPACRAGCPEPVSGRACGRQAPLSSGSSSDGAELRLDSLREVTPVPVDEARLWCKAARPSDPTESFGRNFCTRAMSGLSPTELGLADGFVRACPKDHRAPWRRVRAPL